MKVIENFLTPSYIDNLREMVEKTSYEYIRDTSYPSQMNVVSGDSDKNIFDVGQFTCTIIGPGLDTKQELFAFLNPFLFQVYDSFTEIEFKSIFRMKFNLLTERPDAPIGSYNRPHEDSTKGHSALLYLHDSDGDTVFFKEKYSPSENRPTSFTEDFRIRPKKNTLVFFDSTIYHASSNPRFGGNRYVLNVAFNSEYKKTTE